MNLKGSELSLNLKSFLRMCSMLSAGCSGILETTLQQSSKPWYNGLKNKLDTAQTMANQLCQNCETSYRSVLSSVADLGKTYSAEHKKIDRLLTRSQENHSSGELKKIRAHLDIILNESRNFGNTVEEFEKFLKKEQSGLEQTHHDLGSTVTEIQTGETHLKETIRAINQQLTSLNEQITATRKAISEVEVKKGAGIVNTILGILLVPVTLGVSSVLIGIGVSSVQEAEAKVAALEGNVKSVLTQISALQGDVKDDEKQVTVLKGITISTRQILDDMTGVSSALILLRTQWNIFGNECESIVKRVKKSESAQDLTFLQVWLSAADNAMSVAASTAKALLTTNIAGNRIVRMVRPD